MRDNGGEMTPGQIAEAILAAGLKEATATPAATVGANIYTSIDKLKDRSPFVQVGRARFRLVPENIPQNRCTDRDLTGAEVVESTNRESVIKAFGMFWERDGVDWESPNLKLWGEPSQFGGGRGKRRGAAKANFADESGIYILYDHRTIVYVGRAIQ